MRIFISNIPLSQGSQYQEYPEYFTLTEEHQVHIEHFLNSPQVHTYDRGNIKTTLSFSVTRHHGSVSNAQKFILTHSRQLYPISGPITFQEEDSPTRYILENAVIQKIESTLNGTSTTHTYYITAGKMQESPIID